MLCQSHKGTLNVIDGIVKGYDDLPKLWRSDLIERIQPEQAQVPLQYHFCVIVILFCIEFRYS